MRAQSARLDFPKVKHERQTVFWASFVLLVRMSAVYGLGFLAVLRVRPVVVLYFLELVNSRLVCFLFFSCWLFFIDLLGCNKASCSVWSGLGLALGNFWGNFWGGKIAGGLGTERL